MGRFGNWLKNRFGQPKPRSARRRFVPLSVEALEARELLTIAFTPKFGPDTIQSSAPYTVMNDATVHLILWGPDWSLTPTGTQVDANKVISAAVKVANSGYLSLLGQYGSDGRATIADFVIDNSTPPSDFHVATGSGMRGSSLQEAQDEITYLIDTNQVDGPSDNPTLAQAPIYVIITDPRHSTDGDGNLSGGGVNRHGVVLSNNAYGMNINLIGVGTDTAFQNFAWVFSHELMEKMSNPEGRPSDPIPANSGVVVTPPANIPTWKLDDPGAPAGDWDNWDQICDFEPEASYRYRLGGINGVEVQAAYSEDDRAFVVEDGNSEVFRLNPIWHQIVNRFTGRIVDWTFENTFDLIINGDQLANQDDTILISKDAAGGIEVNLNGQIASFDPGTARTVGTPLNSITVITGGGNNTVTIGDGIAGLPVASINVVGGEGRDSVVVNDRCVNNGNPWLHPRSSPIQVNDGTGLADPPPPPTFAIDGQQVVRTWYPGPDILPLRTTIAYSGLEHLTVIGAPQTSTFAVATDVLATPLTVYGGSAQDVLTFDDSAKSATFSMTYALTTGRVTRTAVDAALVPNGPLTLTSTATVDYENIPTVYVRGGRTESEFDVRSIGSTQMNIIAGPGHNTFNVGDAAHPLDSIAGALNISGEGTDTLVVDDSAMTPDPNFTQETVAFTLAAGTVEAVHQKTYTDAFGPLTFASTMTMTFTGIASATVKGASLPTTFDVLNTPANAVTTIAASPLSTGGNRISVRGTTGALVLNAGSQDQVDIRNTSNNLSSVLGAVTIGDGAAVPGEVSIYDEWDSWAGILPLTYTLTATGLTAPWVAPIYFAGGVNDLQLFLSADVVDVQGTPGVTHLAEYPGNHAYTVNVGTADNTLGSIGRLSVDGQALINLNDQGAITPQGYRFWGSSPSYQFLTTGTLVNYSPSVRAVVLNGGSGGNSISVWATQAVTPVTINAGVGTNTIGFGYQIFSYMDRLDPIHGSVTIQGGGSDTLSLTDQANTVSRTFLLGAGSIGWTGGYVSFSGVGHVALTGGSGDNFFWIQGTTAGAVTDLNAGQGKATFFVQDQDITLNAIQGALNLYGNPQKPALLTLDDSANATPMEYDLTPGQVGWEASGLDRTTPQIDYTNLAGLTLLGSSGGSTIATRALDRIFADLGNNLSVEGPAQIWIPLLARTSIGVQSSSASPSYGDAVTLTATVVSGDPSLGAPAGIVTFFDNGVAIGTSNLDGNGQASITTAGLAAGDHAITASYDGEGDFQGSTSASFTQVVVPAATQTTIATSAVNAVVGQAVTFTAAVGTVTPGLATPSGTVTFMDGSTVLGSVTLVDGVAILQTSALAVGSHSITAIYTGEDGTLAASASSVLTQKVNAAATKITLTSSRATAVYGQAITFKARLSVVAPGAGTPAGTVIFKDGATVLGRAAVNSGVASLSIAKLAPGTHSITAVFVSASGNFRGSTSSAFSQVVQKASTKTRLSGPAAAVAFGNIVTLTAKIMPVAPGAGVPTGSVRFRDGSTVIGTGTLVNGIVTLKISTLKKGIHTMTAVYTGDSHFLASASAGVVVTIV